MLSTQHNYDQQYFTIICEICIHFYYYIFCKILYFGKNY